MSINTLSGWSDSLQRKVRVTICIMVMIGVATVVLLNRSGSNSGRVDDLYYSIEAYGRKAILKFLETERWHGSSAIVSIETKKCGPAKDSWIVEAIVEADYYGLATSEQWQVTAEVVVGLDGVVCAKVVGWSHEDEFSFPRNDNWIQRLWAWLDTLRAYLESIIS